MIWSVSVMMLFMLVWFWILYFNDLMKKNIRDPMVALCFINFGQQAVVPEEIFFVIGIFFL